eukprot:CAMPEP_0171304284 /NCGR_PEP_ID=MMETSP0816-20121228/14001_1 /TAXON_ID=420281 /ORGANISM="Proboscia inermis, Strain CCAP1064/1" /LENGTH=155 /DNA_ID=CAMNT_0011784253 /DNA_START=71 /DNA_END=538 /DNA_ORIENTATION=+
MVALSTKINAQVAAKTEFIRYKAQSFGTTRVIQMPHRGPDPDPHAPPKNLTKEESAAWKNTRGYTIPLDKRLAVDGRRLREHTANEQFATLSESLYVAERIFSVVVHLILPARVLSAPIPLTLLSSRRIQCTLTVIEEFGHAVPALGHYCHRDRG